MDVVLSVLQVMGWVLLAILGIFLLLILLLLFCPVKYRMQGEWIDEKWIRAKVHWFLHLFRVEIFYENSVIHVKGRLLWKKISFSQDLSSKKETENILEEEVSPAKKEEDPVVGDDQETSESMISKIKGMIERIKRIYPKFKKMISDEMNQAAVAHIKGELLYMFKMILPKKSKVDAVFSNGSPDTTGQLFGVLACFPITYSKGWNILPDFTADEAYFKGTFLCNGRIYGYKYLAAMLRIVFDKKCRRLYNIVNKFIEIVKSDINQEVK